MFRKLILMETEAVRQHSEACEGGAGFSDAALKAFAGELAHCVPSLPQRFGVCASGVG